MKKAKGFTIIELLIVILVIGILAAITLVAYGAVQQRSHNAKTAQAVREYLNALTGFYGENGRYPTEARDGVGDYNCLGLSVCWSGTYTQNTAMNTLMQGTLGSTLPTPYSPSPVYYGIVYIPSDMSIPWKLDGQPVSWLIYGIEGASTTCPVGPIATYTSGQALTSTVPASGRTTQSATSTPNPTCWIPLT